MNTSEFIKKVKEHLSVYKRKLGIPEDEKGIFYRRGERLEYGHILRALRGRKMNFLPSIREPLWSYVLEKEIELHTCFLHLNSSQAMCMNFFYPLFIIRQLESVIFPFLPDQVNGEIIDYDSVCFEKPGSEAEWLGENKTEMIDCRPTSFDFYFRTTSGTKFFFEVKYTESKFSGTKSDEEHIKKYNFVYKNHLSHIKDEYCTQKVFFRNYQIMRNLAHIDKDSLVIFIYPSQNKGIVNGIKIAENALKNYTDHFIPIEWKNLVAMVESRLEEKFIEEFKEKYLNFEH